MKVMKHWFLGFALAAMVPSGLALAESGQQDNGQAVYTRDRQPVAVPVNPVARPVNNPLTASQKEAIAQGKGPRPGVYRIRSVLSGRCIVVSSAGANPPAETWDCENRDTWQHGGFNNHWIVLPHPSGGFTLRGHPQRLRFENQRPPRVGEYGSCLSVARGVILGAPRIELQPCETPGGDWVYTAADYQRFFLVPIGQRAFLIGSAEVGDASECLSLYNGGRGDGTGVIRWPCARTSEQMWELEWYGAIAPDYENDLLRETYWYRTPRGHFNILGADGLALSGTPYSSFETVNDGGDYCRKRCAELDRCKAWTWQAPGFVTNSNDPPRCLWFDTVGEPINRGAAMLGKIRSGIVRP
ncbi:MAG: PAN domain-containing protein [Novosphingobium sp.]